MFKLLKKKHNVLGYRFDIEDIFFEKVNNDRFVFKTDKYENFVTREFFGNPVFWNGYFILSNPNTKKIVFFKDGKKFKEDNYCVKQTMGEYLVTVLRTKSERSIIFLNKDFTIAFKKDFRVGGVAYSNDNLIACPEIAVADKLHIFQVSDGKFRFDTVDISHNTWKDSEGKKRQGEIIQIIGQWNNELIVCIGKYRIVSFDLDTFEELWRIEDFLADVSSDPMFNFKNPAVKIKWKLLAKENKAYLLINNLLYILDLETKKSILTKDFNDGNQEWLFKHFRVYDDYITFSANNEFALFPMVVGVMDRHTHEILWTEKSDSYYFEEAPQLKDNKLYVLTSYDIDSEKTLYIYERE